MSAGAAELERDRVVIPGGDPPPGGRRFWVTPDMVRVDKHAVPVPVFGVEATAQMFFARSGSWLRMRMRPHPPEFPHGYFVLDGKPLKIRRTKSDARIFSLADIEPMAWALAQNGVIDSDQLTAIIQLVKWSARLHGILDD